MRRPIERICFAVFSLAVVAHFVRLQSLSIRFVMPINIDESEILAAGRRAAMSYIPFKDFTASSYGPIWSFTLGWLHRLGLPLTLPAAHLLSAAIAAGTCIVIARVVWRRWNLVAAVIVSGSLALHWANGFSQFDFLSLTTESLPCVLLVAGCLVAFPAQPITTRRAFIAAALLGASVWSKYSFVFLVAVALAALLVTLLDQGTSPPRAVSICVIGPLAPYGVLVAWALFYGVPLWKTTESIALTLDYVRGGGLYGISPTFGERMEAVRKGLAIFPSLIPLAVFLTLVVAVGFARQGSRAWVRHPITRLPRATLVQLLAIASVVASLVSFASAVPLFPHYGFLLIGGVVQATILLASVPGDPGDIPVATLWRTIAVTAAAAVIVVPPLVDRPRMNNFLNGYAPPPPSQLTSWSGVLTTRGGLHGTDFSASPTSIVTLCPPRSKVVVWGWAPELYAHNDWVPATRYVATVASISGFPYAPNVEKYRARMLGDIRAEQPRCIVDAAVPKLFGTWSTPQSLEVQWPALVAELSTGYTRRQALLYGSIPLTIWVRNT